MTSSPNTTTPSRTRWRTAYLVLATLVILGVVVQVALAGLAVFDLPEMWRWHARFVNVIETSALLLLLVALAGRLRGLRWPAAVLLLLIGSQHGTAALGGFAGAFHTVNALVLLLLGHMAVRRARMGIDRPELAASRSAPPA
jgi:hypothetical protein